MSMKPRQWTTTHSATLSRARQGAFEIALMSLLFAIYYVTRGVAAGKESVAFVHARDVMNLERRLDLFHEMAVQSWLLAVPAVIRLLNYVYAYTHMAGLVIFGVWLFLRHADQYRKYRNIFLGVLGSGLLIYILFPLAPPRFFPYSGFVDTLSLFSGINYDQPSVAAFYNPFAAMPSLHVAFALFCGIGVIQLGRSVAHWLLGVCYPLLMVAAVVGTGNHYILDALAGATLTVLAYLLVPRIMSFWDRRSGTELADPTPSRASHSRSGTRTAAG